MGCYIGELVIEFGFPGRVGGLVGPMVMIFAWVAHDLLVGASWSPCLVLLLLLLGSRLDGLVGCCNKV